MEDSKLSILSFFIKKRIRDKRWNIKKFAEKAGLSASYAYELVVETREKIPTDETLNKIADVLRLSAKYREYIFDIARRERESGEIIYEEPVPEPDSSPASEFLPDESGQMSVLSGFIKHKIKVQWGCIKDFARKANLNNTYIYDILSVKRDFTLTDKTLLKFLNVLRLSDEEKNFVFSIAKKEREIGNLIYTGDISSELIPHSSLPPLLEDSQESFASEDSPENLAQMISKEFRLSRFKGEEIIKKIRDIITSDISFAKDLGLEEMLLKFLRKKASFKIESSEICPIDDIIIHEQYLNIRPKREQIQEIIEYYKKYGKLDKPLKVQRTMILIDGYKRYIAAKELGLSEVEANFVSKPYKEVSQPLPLQLNQQEKKKIIVPKRKPGKGILAENLRGKIKRVSYGQGFGFINGEDEEVYFFHYTSLKGVAIDRLEVEYRVIFDVKNSPKGPVAINIREDV